MYIKRLSVNDIMVSPMFAADVPAGQKIDEGIVLIKDILVSYGISDIASIEFEFGIKDYGTNEHIVFDIVSDVVQLNTNISDTVSQEYDSSGIIAYDVDDIKIVILNINYDSVYGTELSVYVENNSNSEITLEADNVIVNGYEVKHSYLTNLPAGKIAYDTIVLMGDAFRKKDITVLEYMELNFLISTPDDIYYIFESELIRVDFEN